MRRILKKQNIVPEKMCLPLVIAVLFNFMTYCGSRIITKDRFHYDLSSGLDGQIELVPWTIVIYLGSYVYWIVNYIIGCRQVQKMAFRFISADFMAKIICLMCFLFFPTTVVRPNIEADSVWHKLVIWLYSTDAADNLFPSIHCLTSWFCFIAVRGNSKIPKWYKYLSAALTIGICISTLTTKQHVVIDVAAGIALAEGCWRLIETSGFSKKYTDVMLKMEGTYGKNTIHE